MRLHTREEGPRDPSRGSILFVHGFPFDGSMWDPVLAGLPDGWRGLAPDLRGFGGTPLAADGGEPAMGSEVAGDVARNDEPVLTMDRHADDLAAELDARGAGPAVVCGLSMGGYVAFALRRRHPRLVRALVLADTRATADGAEALEDRRRTAEAVRSHGARPIATAMPPTLLAERTLRERGDVVDHVRRMILATPPATLIAALAGMAARPDSTPDLPGLDRPTLVVVGEEDALTPPDAAREMAAAIPGARLEMLAGAGHLAPLEAPEAFLAALEGFLAKL